MNFQVEPQHYYDSKYDSIGRFCSYWHQIDEIISLQPKEVLEIGIGNGFVSKYLKERGIHVVTMDIDTRLKPDLTGNILDIPLYNESFEVVACYELLEHLPFTDFNKALSETWRVSKRHVLISIPDVNRVYCESLYIPKIGEIRILIPRPTWKKHKHTFNGEHYWEIGEAGYSLKSVRKGIEGVGFKIKKTYRIFEYTYHRMFILEKREGIMQQRGVNDYR